MDLANGGTINSSQECYIGRQTGSEGMVKIDGFGSTWTGSKSLNIGVYGGSGILGITNKGMVSSNNVYIGHYLSGSVGKVTVDGVGSRFNVTEALQIGLDGTGTLDIINGGQVSVGGELVIDYYSAGDCLVNMSTGGKLALFGEGYESIADFLDLVEGTDAIRFWDESIKDWAAITDATYGVDYTLEYLTEGDLAGYTVLTVPEPVSILLLGLGSLLLSKKCF